MLIVKSSSPSKVYFCAWLSTLPKILLHIFVVWGPIDNNLIWSKYSNHCLPSFFSSKKAVFITVLPLENIIASTFLLEIISIVSSGIELGHLVSYAATSNTRAPDFLNWSAIRSLPPVWTLGTKTRSP